MRKLLVLIVLSLAALTGCGSSSSSSGPTLTSGTTYEAGQPNNVTTIAGTAGNAGSTDATGTSALFGQPNGVVVSPDGTTLYITDVVNNTIRRMDLATKAVTTLAGNSGFSGATDATGTNARFNAPQAVTTDGTNLYVADFSNNSIRQVVISSGVVTTLAGSTSGLAGADDGIGTAARFNGPAGITTDGTNLYVADFYNSSVRRIVIATGAVTTMTLSSPFSNPAGIISDGTNLYVTDFKADTISRIVISSGVVSTMAGSTAHYGSADGTGSAASFNGPGGITLIGSNLYVADAANNVIRKIVIASGVVTTVAGTAGTPGSTDGIGAAAGFNVPIGITTDGTNLYVGDAHNKTIRIIQ